MDIMQWWSSLDIITQVLYCLAIPSTLLLLIQTVLTFIGMDGDSDASGAGEVSSLDTELDTEVDIADDILEGDVVHELDSEGLSGLRIFTLRGIVAFFVVFSWVGIAMLGSSVHVAITVPVSVLCGFLMMFLLAYLTSLMMKLRNDGNTDNRNAVGTSGKVYLSIPAKRSGTGKVQVMLQGAYVERDAVTDDDSPIPTGSEILVVGVSGQTELVVKRK